MCTDTLTKCCPKECCEEMDYNYAIVQAVKYKDIVERKLFCSYQDLKKILNFNYSCDYSPEEDIDNLHNINGVLTRELLRYKHRVRCLCNLTNVIEKIERTKKCNAAITNVQITKDESWAKRNPYCVSRENWEMYSEALCALFKLNFTLVNGSQETIQTKCNIAFEITKVDHFCDILITTAVVKAACEIGAAITVTKQQCKLEWGILIEKNPSCKIDLKTYTKCKEEGLTYDVIQLIIDAGLDIQTRDGELFLLGLLQEYKFNELSFDGIPSRTEETEHFYKDPKAFVEKYLRDYKLTQHQIDIILKK